MDVLEKWVHRFAKYCGDDEKLKKKVLKLQVTREYRLWITHIYTVIFAFAKKKKKKWEVRQWVRYSDVTK